MDGKEIISKYTINFSQNNKIKKINNQVEWHNVNV